MELKDIESKWDELKKALNHAIAIPKAAVEEPKDDSFPDPHPDHLPKVKYGKDSSSPMPDMSKEHIGQVKVSGKNYVVRHGAAAQRTDTEHQMAKLLGADHMVPEQSYDHGLNHPDHHRKPTYNPHEHGGTSFQEYVKGKDLHDALKDKGLTGKLRDQWKNGDLHKLWALHYISNNGDMHTGNFHVDKDGVKAFDSDMAFHELPQAHTVSSIDGGKTAELNYNPHSFSQLPAYVSPFVDRENDEDIKAKHADDQVSVKSLNEHAKNIDPTLFEKFGPHAAERAAKAKSALASADPTSEMLKLWDGHQDLTGELNWKRNLKDKKKAA